MSKYLTKSKYVSGLQCPRLLWFLVNDKEHLPETSQEQQHVFDQGTYVGKLATSLYPKGIKLMEDDFNLNLKQTEELMKKHKIIFEGSVSTDNLYARADILIPEKNGYNLIEVKSSTKVKEEHYHDVSFQKYVFELKGHKINKCFLMHLNNEYVRKTKLSVKKLFVLEEITDEVIKAQEGIESRIADMFKIIARKTPPEIKLGRQCSSPYACALEEECWQSLPEGNVFELHNHRKKYELFDLGIKLLVDVPDEYILHEKHNIQRECAKTGKPFMDINKLKEFLKDLKEPIYFLDFETYQMAVPPYNNLKPYQRIPFQFSLHINNESNHHMFLAKNNKDPRLDFLKALKSLLNDKGAVIVYNQSFEKGVLKELGEAYPKYQKWIDSLSERIVDLLEPFRQFYYYNPAQKGSASIKSVLPALVGKSYKGMDIGNGIAASVQYFNAIHGAFSGIKMAKEEKNKIFADLEKYCALDTLAEVWILERLRKLTQ